MRLALWPRQYLRVVRATLSLAVAVLLGSASDASAEIDTGAECVTALHEETVAAGPLPSRLTSLLEPAGQRRLAECSQCASYAALMANFPTQVTQAFCGVASSVAVLNASAVQKPLTDPYRPYRYFSQCNIFNPAAREQLDLATISNEGLTLAQAAYLLNAQPGVHATCFHAGAAAAVSSVSTAGVPACEIAVSTAQFRHAAADALGRPQQFVLANFSRATLSDDNRGGGHFSPLAAYHVPTDSLLVLDVARYKYPPFWADADLLWAAMATPDSSSGQNRGYIVVQVGP
ncbi:MAG: phytochelatin synthase family protein [Geminicoccaceae bacterium]